MFTSHMLLSFEQLSGGMRDNAVKGNDQKYLARHATPSSDSRRSQLSSTEKRISCRVLVWTIALREIRQFCWSVNISQTELLYERSSTDRSFGLLVYRKSYSSTSRPRDRTERVVGWQVVWTVGMQEIGQFCWPVERSKCVYRADPRSLTAAYLVRPLCT